MKIKQFFKNLQKEGILMPIVTMVIGVMLVIFPKTILTYTCYAIGAFFLAWGIYHIIRYFNKSNDYSSLDLIVGIFSVLFSVIFFIKPDFIVSLMPKIFAVILFIDGIVKLSTSLKLNKRGYKRWWIMFVCAMLMMVGGIVVFYYSFAISAFILKVIGVFLIIDSIMDIYKLIICKIKLSSKKDEDDNSVKVESVKTVKKDNNK